MEYEDPIDDDELESLSDNAAEQLDAERPSVSTQKSSAEKSARKRIEELAERQRLRHEVDYLADLDEADESSFDYPDDEFDTRD